LKKNKTYKYYFIAGEASGDLHGGNLMKEIKTLNPSVDFYGIGGKSMEKEGLRSLVSLKKLAILGFWEVFKNLRFFINLKKQVLQDIQLLSPDKIILIDYPGFNLKLATAIKQKSSIPIIYYISPQLWAWKENRIKTIKENVDKMIVLFPFEKQWYKKRGLQVFYFGHPLIELHNRFLQSYCAANRSSKYTIALLPGSRNQELKRHLPIYKKIIYELNKTNLNIHYIIKLFDLQNFNAKQDLGLHKNFSIEKGESFKAFHDSDFALVASGTATLEGAIANTPMAVIYQTSWISWFLAKIFLRIPFISLVNILNKEKVVEEFIQHQANPKIIANYILRVMKNRAEFNYSKIKQDLNKNNIYKRTAGEILK